ncbi:hypothetical protein B0H14DRAFT_3430998 [Mycena olivaceomarginata]|nr:hypothetical protein B0H14DRAFT_3430998 [Mycena olivaceomarginata]
MFLEYTDFESVPADLKLLQQCLIRRLSAPNQLPKKPDHPGSPASDAPQASLDRILPSTVPPLHTVQSFHLTHCASVCARRDAGGPSHHPPRSIWFAGPSAAAAALLVAAPIPRASLAASAAGVPRALHLRKTHSIFEGRTPHPAWLVLPPLPPPSIATFPTLCTLSPSHVFVSHAAYPSLRFRLLRTGRLLDYACEEGHLSVVGLSVSGMERMDDGQRIARAAGAFDSPLGHRSSQLTILFKQGSTPVPAPSTSVRVVGDARRPPPPGAPTSSPSLMPLGCLASSLTRYLVLASFWHG